MIWHWLGWHSQHGSHVPHFVWRGYLRAVRGLGTACPAANRVDLPVETQSGCSKLALRGEWGWFEDGIKQQNPYSYWKLKSSWLPPQSTAHASIKKKKKKSKISIFCFGFTVRNDLLHCNLLPNKLKHIYTSCSCCSMGHLTIMVDNKRQIPKKYWNMHINNNLKLAELLKIPKVNHLVVRKRLDLSVKL